MIALRIIYQPFFVECVTTQITVGKWWYALDPRLMISLRNIILSDYSLIIYLTYCVSTHSWLLLTYYSSCSPPRTHRWRHNYPHILESISQTNHQLFFHQNIENIDDDECWWFCQEIITSFTSPVFNSRPFFFAFVSDTTKREVIFYNTQIVPTLLIGPLGNQT